MTNLSLAQTVLNTLHEVLSKDEGFIGLHEPQFSGNEWTYVKECLDTGWVSSVGKYVDRFEADLAAYTGVKHAVAVVNGTAALHVCLLLSGVAPNDEVLIPSLTFVATANAVAYCGAIPHFVDVSTASLGIDPQRLDAYLEAIGEPRPDGFFNRQTGRRIKAVIPMHTFGHPVDLDPLAQVCARFGLTLIEDAAEALGSLYKGHHAGHWGSVSALSFNGNKILTTGGGGAILTNDAEIARQAKHLTTTAKLPHRWAFQHDRIAYNYRLPNLNAALGCAQLEQLDRFIQDKRQLSEKYRAAFAAVDGVTFFTEPDYARSNYWLNALLFDEPVSHQRDEFLELSNQHGVMTRPVWSLMHTLPMYTSCPRMDLSVSESVEKRLVNIPSSAKLGQQHDHA